jgi:hypothetical protein
MRNLFFITLLLYLSNSLSAQNITKVEYFIDTDPGYGLATNVTLTAANNLDLDFFADMANLEDGIHILFVRAKDSNNKWSLTKSQVFYNGIGATNQPISNIEYFFDTDPGFGKGTLMSVAPSNKVDISFNIDISALKDGIHILFVRAKDNNEQWSLTKTHTFYKGILSSGSASKIQTIEYYFDTDPGFGNGVKVSFVADTLIDLTFNTDLTTLSEGFHMLFIRAQNEDSGWSLVKTHPFWNTATIIAQSSLTGFKIFPNPSHRDFNIQFESKNHNSNLEIYNIKGQIVLSKNYYDNSVNDKISLSGTKGLYLLKLVSGEEIQTKIIAIE